MCKRKKLTLRVLPRPRMTDYSKKACFTMLHPKKPLLFLGSPSGVLILGCSSGS